MAGRIVLFGASGYTGALTAEALVERGAQPVLAGRDRTKLERLRARLGRDDLEIALADASDPSSVASLVAGGDVLVTTVGPFLRYGHAALEAAVAAPCVYIDSTGEPPFIREVFESYGPRAARSGAVLLTALGYDYVPGNLAGALALEVAGEDAVRVDVGYFVDGRPTPDAMSGGTRASLAGVAGEPSFAFRGGSLATERAARRVRTFELTVGSRKGISVGGSEHLALPRSFPQLEEVNVYLGWFAALSRPMQLVSAVGGALRRLPAARAATARLADALHKSGEGPSEATRARVGSRIVACAYDRSGRELARVELAGVNAYDFTARMLALAALRAKEGAINGSGALGPVEAFGLRALEQLVEEAGIRRVA